jgi:hypothetical protein
MRLPVLFALLILGPCAAVAADGSFSGAWVAWICPAGIQYDPIKCANLVLQLHQKQDKVCGAHVFATAGARQIDEGGAPSLTGTIADGTATVSVESGRTAQLKVQVELRMARGGLQWRRVDNPEGDYLLPLSAQLTKSKHGSLLHPVFAQKLEASCAAILNQSSAPASAPSTAPRPSAQ